MLKFTSLTIENFGPYKGIQTIDFTDKNGVTIIEGDNGRGKTTLLNIFRYALFGYYQNRREQDVDLMKLVNTEGKKEGHWNFKIVLKMVNDDGRYELTRQYTVRNDVSVPKSDDDYEKNVYLKENGTLLSPDQREHVLNNIMPSDVSRFFLFDGELLQQYEELLDNDSETSTAIKESIERILGVPVLTNGATDTQIVLDSYKHDKNKIAENDKQTQKLATRIDAQEKEKNEHDKEISRLNEEIEELTAERTNLQNELSQNDRVKTLLANMDSLEKNIENEKAHREDVMAQISAYTKDAWKWLASDRIDKVIADLNKQIDSLSKKESAHTIQKNTLSEMKNAAQEHHCAICGQDVDDAHVQDLLNRIATYTQCFDGLSDEETRSLQQMNVRKTSLEEMKATDKTEELSKREDELTQLDIQIADDQKAYNDIIAELEQHGNVQDLANDTNNKISALSKCMVKIENDKKAIQSEKEKVNAIREALATLNEQIDKYASNSDAVLAKKKVNICEKVNKIFEEGISKYRDKLKTDVERDASELFVSIRSDPDYVKLRINDNYGLQIIDKDGDVVPLRSAGYEHIVALSLIGALHKNAPLQGPIVMDSTFFRLSPEHKHNTIKALLDMSNQIILLVMPEEIDEQDTRAALGSSLLGEYRLERRSGSYTEIERQ